MGAGRVLAGAVVGGLVSLILTPLLAPLPLIGGILVVVIGGCAAGLVARGTGAGATAGFLTTIIFIGVLFVIGGTLLELTIGRFAPFLRGMGVSLMGAISTVLLILSIPTACCMTVSGAIGGAMNKPPIKPVTVEVKPTQKVISASLTDKKSTTAESSDLQTQSTKKISVQNTLKTRDSTYLRKLQNERESTREMLYEIDKGLVKGTISESRYVEFQAKYELRLEQLDQEILKTTKDLEILQKSRFAREKVKKIEGEETLDRVEAQRLERERRVIEGLNTAILELLAKKIQTGGKLSSKEITNELRIDTPFLKNVDVIHRLLELVKEGKIERVEEQDKRLRYFISMDKSVVIPAPSLSPRSGQQPSMLTEGDPVFQCEGILRDISMLDESFAEGEVNEEDYTKKKNELQSKLHRLRENITERMEKLQKEIESLESEKTSFEKTLEELKARQMIGLFTETEYNEKSSVIEARLDETDKTLSANLKKVERIQKCLEN